MWKHFKRKNWNINKTKNHQAWRKKFSVSSCTMITRPIASLRQGCLFLKDTRSVTAQHLTFRYLISSAGLPSDVVLISWQWWKNLCRCRSYGENRTIILSHTHTRSPSSHQLSLRMTDHLCVYLKNDWMKRVLYLSIYCWCCMDPHFEQCLCIFHPLDVWLGLLKCTDMWII